jgi:hypothetical protein
MSLEGRGGGSNEARRDEMRVYASIKCRSSDHLPAAVPARRTIATAVMMIPPPMPQNGSSSIAELPSHSPASRTEPYQSRPDGRPRWVENTVARGLDVQKGLGGSCVRTLFNSRTRLRAPAGTKRRRRRRLLFQEGAPGSRVRISFGDASSRGRPEYSIQGRARSLVPLRKATSRPRAGNISDRR